MKKVDIGVGIVLIVLAVAVIHFANVLPSTNTTDVGAGETEALTPFQHVNLAPTLAREEPWFLC